MARLVLAATLGLAMASVANGESKFCDESPTRGDALSVGRASNGALRGAVRLKPSSFVRVLPSKSRRCIDWGTPRLIEAIVHAAEVVAEEFPGSPPLGVGDLSRARGGPIRSYSRSHQSGRDADLAFFQLDAEGQAVAAEDFVRFDSRLSGATCDGEARAFDLARNWLVVRALLDDPGIKVRWVFVSRAIREALLAEGRREKVPQELLARAADVLHQPSDAPPHDDHLHLRIACKAAEILRGCRD
jgi:murein endopeptidase